MLDILPFGVNVRGAYSSWGSYAELIAWASGHFFFAAHVTACRTH